MKALGDYMAVLQKDLRLELRSREVIYSILLFSVLAVVILAFGFTWVSKNRNATYAPGALWLTVLFSATTGFNRFFDREKENAVFQGILLTPVSRAGLFLAKVTAQLLFILMTEVVFVPLILMFFNVGLALPGIFLAELILGTVAIVLVGTLFAALLMNARVRDVLLPIIIFPLSIPILLAGIKVSTLAFGAPLAEDPMKWLHFSAGYDIILLILTVFIFEKAVDL